MPVLDPGPVAIVDTREQQPLTPWLIKSGARFRLATKRATLTTGDYSLVGLESHVAVERKSLGDLIGTLFGSTTDSVGERAGHQDRFRAELDRMRAYACRVLLIEGARADIWAHRYESTVEPMTVLNLVDALAIDYSVHVVWAGNATEAGRILGTMLARIWEQASGGPASRKALVRGIAAHLPWCSGGRSNAAEGQQ